MPSRRLPTDEERAGGQRLRDIRKRQGLSSMQVAIALGTTQTNYEFYEQGRNKIRGEQIKEFADALGVTPHELYDALYAEPVRSFERERMGYSLVASVL